jgi:hypothetical protein
MNSRILPIAFLSLAGLVVGAVGSAAAQEPSIHEQLVARGAPVAFAGQVAAIVAAAQADHLPVEPLESKALEGWAKRGRVPPERVLAVMRHLVGRLEQGRDAVRAAGLDGSDAVIAGAADALNRGLTSDHISEIVTAAPDPPAAAVGLTVASSLAAQGLDAAASVRAVSDAYRNGRGPEEILEFPSAVADATAHGERMTDIGQRIMQGGTLAPPGGGAGGTGSGTGGAGGRPPGLPGSKQGTKTQTNKP